MPELLFKLELSCKTTDLPLTVCAQLFTEGKKKKKDKQKDLDVALTAKGTDCGLYILEN